ncbi:MAG: YajQ family cyclic di-GMP-binding protein [Zetaproteobacteria bacterium]|nr:YajQ family cyclic di-GMP-binding protein [Pseudobdellovibrionaceae bacterium]|tara:strand:- start:271 stop:762 length:492 start_codon:yes stop_codon:yes gene_type:complete
MPSFDIVCEIDLQEVDNAVNQAIKEISSRFDFRGSKSKLSFERSSKNIQILAEDEFKLRSIHQILETKFAKRQLDCRLLKYQEKQISNQNMLKQNVELRSGLEKDEAKQITATIKNLKIKVQAQIQDQQVRVSGKKIDDLQAVIQSLKENDLGLPLQYINMRG